MKKLNITKEQFNRSNYFQKKYGKLEYVSESGRLFKTSKGKVLKFNEAVSYGLTNDELDRELDNGLDDGSIKVGDIMYSVYSWDYDTVPHFYKVCQVKKSTILLQKLRSKSIGGYANSPGGAKLVPDESDTSGETIRVRIKPDGSMKEPGRYGNSLNKWDGKPKEEVRMNESGVKIDDRNRHSIILSRECPFCHKEHKITLDMSDAEFYDGIDALRHGALIQQAFPTLSPSEREFLKTGICDDCWDSL